MRLREIALVAARELRDALRSRWFVLAAGCFLALSLGLSMLGLAGAQRSGLAGFDRTTASLLNLALLFVPLLTLSLGGLGIAGELEDGSLAMLLSQPITRFEAYAGKYLGLLAAVSASILAGFGATGVIVGVSAGGGNVRGFAMLVALTLLLGAATLSIGTLFSVALRTRARVIGAAFSMWLLLVYVSDLGTIGLTIARNLGPAQIFILALLNPVQQARVLGTLTLSQRLDVLGPVGVFGLDQFGMMGLTALLLGVLVATAAAPLACGYVLFRRTPVT
jgi:Cu-processing system permease protein